MQRAAASDFCLVNICAGSKRLSSWLAWRCRCLWACGWVSLQMIPARNIDLMLAKYRKHTTWPMRRDATLWRRWRRRRRWRRSWHWQQTTRRRCLPSVCFTVSDAACALLLRKRKCKAAMTTATTTTTGKGKRTDSASPGQNKLKPQQRQSL